MSGKLHQRNTNLESSESLGKHLFRFVGNVVRFMMNYTVTL